LLFCRWQRELVRRPANLPQLIDEAGTACRAMLEAHLQLPGDLNPTGRRDWIGERTVDLALAVVKQLLDHWDKGYLLTIAKVAAKPAELDRPFLRWVSVAQTLPEAIADLRETASSRSEDAAAPADRPPRGLLGQVTPLGQLEQRRIARLEGLIQALDAAKDAVMSERAIPVARPNSSCYQALEVRHGQALTAARALISQIKGQSTSAGQLNIGTTGSAGSTVQREPQGEGDWWFYTEIQVEADPQHRDVWRLAIKRRGPLMTREICERVREAARQSQSGIYQQTRAMVRQGLRRYQQELETRERALELSSKPGNDCRAGKLEEPRGG
jgi:hypothetical protein